MTERQSLSVSPATPPIAHGFNDLWVEALANYKKQTGHEIDQAQMAQFPDRPSVEIVVSILEGQSNDFEAFRKKGEKIRAILRPVARIVEMFNDMAAEVAAAAPVPGGKAIFVAFGVLLKASKGVTEVYDALEELSEKLHDGLTRIEKHFGSDFMPSPALKDIYIQMLVQVLRVVGFLTPYQDSNVKKRRRTFVKRTELFWKSLFGNKEVQEALSNLDKLTNRETLMRIAEIQETVNEVRRMQLDNKIEKWLSPLDISQSHDTLYQTQQDGTGRWLFALSSKFSQWKNARNSVLWIHGKPGSGKSVLCSSTIEALRQEPGLAFFYFDFRDSAKQTVYGFLATLVFQLSSRSASCSRYLTQFHQDHHHTYPEHPNNDLLFQCLNGMLQALPNVYLVCDGLDEIPEATRNQDLFSIIQKLIGCKKEGLHMLVTSRPEQDIKKNLMSCFLQDSNLSDLHVLDLDKTDDHAKDIHSFIINQVSMMEGWSRILKKTVQESLLSKADGMFLLASQQLQILHDCQPIDIAEVLDTLPTSLNDTYKRILENIPSINRLYALRIFECLAYAKRPLSPEELAEVFAVKFQSNGDAILQPEYRSLNAEDRLLKICSTLIQIIDGDGKEQSSRIVQFAHLSIKEYLCSNETNEKYQIRPEEAHTTLAKVCISNLMYPAELLVLPLGFYVADYWLGHLLNSNYQVMKAIKKHLQKLLHPQASKQFTKWRGVNVCGRSYNENARALYCAAGLGELNYVQGWLTKTPDIINDQGGPAGTALCVASKINQVEVVHFLLKHNAAVDAQDDNNWTPLHIAAHNCHLEVAHLLLKHNAAVDAPENKKRTPLHLAAQNGHIKVVRLLLEHNAAVDAQENKNKTPLHLAAENGHLEVAHLLLDCKAAVEAQTINHITPLYKAAQNGYLEIVELLLDLNAAVNAQNMHNWTALHSAAANGHIDIACLLLEHNAEVDAQDDRNWTPLHLVAQNGHPEIARLLLEHKAAVDAQSNESITPLHKAAQNGHFETVQLLLNCNAAVNAKNMYNWTALHSAAAHGHLEIACLLLEHKAVIDAQENNSWTPLHLAAHNGHLEVAHLLLKHKTSVDAQENRNQTPLHHAVQNGHHEIAQLLLEHNAAVDAQENKNRTPLHLAAQTGHLEVAHLLLEHRAAVDAQEDKSWTPLHLAAQNGHLEVAQLLLDCGAIVDAQTNIHATPLYKAAQNGHLDIVQLLLDHNAAVNAKNTDKWTALHSAAAEGHHDVAHLLLEHKAAIDAQENSNLTPLHLAAQNGHFKVVHLLLDSKAAVDAQEVDHWTPLHLAAQHGHIEVTHLLLNSEAAVNAKEEDNWTPLHFAAQNGHLEVARLLLAHNAEVDSQDNDHCTPLHIAAEENHGEIACLLLKTGAAINALDIDDRTPLCLAAQNGHLEVVHLLLNNKAVVDAKADDNWTPLHFAAEEGHIGVARLLIEYHAAIDALTDAQESPLLLAEQNGHDELAQILKSHI